jgi:adenylate cyclase class 2
MILRTHHASSDNVNMRSVMAESREIEAKVLGVDPVQMAARIAGMGGVHIDDRMNRRYVYDLGGDTSRWIRPRDTGSEVTLCVKQILSADIDGVLETEVVVSDFDTTNTILEILGFKARAYQENRRSSWTLNGVRLEIDTWPLIPTYLEIEADTIDALYATTSLLELGREQLTTENTTDVYTRYGYDLPTMPQLRFPE